MEKIELKIENMSCGHCTRSVEKVLKSVEGVEEVEVILPSTAVITFDPAKTNPGALIDAVNDTDIYTAAEA